MSPTTRLATDLRFQGKITNGRGSQSLTDSGKVSWPGERKRSQSRGFIFLSSLLLILNLDSQSEPVFPTQTLSCHCYKFEMKSSYHHRSMVHAARLV